MFSGQWLTEEELPKNIDTSSLKQHPGIIKGRCQRCGNRKRYKLARFPHAACGKKCLYCRNCIQMGRITECQPLYQMPSSHQLPQRDTLAWRGTLTSHQQHASDNITETILQNDTLLVHAVCGAGKTEMIFSGIEQALEDGKRVCIATPRADVVRELHPRLEKAFPGIPVACLYGGHSEQKTYTPIVLSTTHQLFRYKQAFDVLIIDEVDAFPYHNDPSLQWATQKAARKQSSIIYLTATPRKQQKHLPKVFVPVRYHGHPLPVPAFHLAPRIKTKLPDFPPSKRQLLLFAPTITRATEIAEELRIPVVHSESPDREEIILGFRKKEIHTLVTTTILERGVTFPSVDVYVIDAGHEVFDEAALVQIAGRAGRSADDPFGDVRFYMEGKTDAIIEARHSINSMNKRGGEL
ncbi:DEAD/DEAH box helicase [Salimicrobium sp. PL1-032A]|uniref:DEAD/DEAH box helicase n=1 Tax=Salimicrobium sp. PL1-032A TaxID=3095364 RepID=UPI003261AEE2